MEETTLSGRLPFNSSVSTKKLKSNRLIRKRQVLETLTHFFILLFTYASLRKLVDLKMFVREVWSLSLFGSKLAVKWEFIVLSSVELIIALLLTIQRTRLAGWYGAFILMVGINCAMLYMQQFALIIPIYYGGIIPFAPFIVQFYFNILVLFICLFGMLSYMEVKKQNS